jgi:hypothetical protein
MSHIVTWHHPHGEVTQDPNATKKVWVSQGGPWPRQEPVVSPTLPFLAELVRSPGQGGDTSRWGHAGCHPCLTCETLKLEESGQ